MAADTFQKLGDSMGRAITKISVKTSSSIEKSKLKLHIDSLNREVQVMLSVVGDELYTLWCSEEPSYQSLTEKLEAVKLKKDEIERLSAELVSIDERDNEIFGKKPEFGQGATNVFSQCPRCPACGAEHDPAAKFCRKCGGKLQ